MLCLEVLASTDDGDLGENIIDQATMSSGDGAKVKVEGESKAASPQAAKPDCEPEGLAIKFVLEVAAPPSHL